MKKMLMGLILFCSLNVQAGLFDGWINWEKVATTFLQVSDNFNKRLEQIRLAHHEEYDHRQEWEILCDGTSVLKQNLEIMDLLLNKYNFATPKCLPLTHSLQLSSKIMGRCMEYYDKDVQINFDNNFADAMLLVGEAQLVLNQCYPWLGAFVPGTEE